MKTKNVVLPTVELDVRKTFQFANKKFSLECKIDSHPIDKAYWLKNGVIYDGGKHKHLVQHGDVASSSSTGHSNDNIKVEQYDLSNINDQFKILLTLNVLVRLVISQHGAFFETNLITIGIFD
jgi:hypothetical protein